MAFGAIVCKMGWQPVCQVTAALSSTPNHKCLLCLLMQVIGVQPAASDVMRQSVAAGHIVDAPSSDTLSDATAGALAAQLLGLALEHGAFVNQASVLVHLIRLAASAHCTKAAAGICPLGDIVHDDQC